MRIEFYSYVDNYVHPDNFVSFVTDSFLLRNFYVSVSCVKIDPADSVLRVFINDIEDFNKIFDCFESYKIPPK